MAGSSCKGDGGELRGKRGGGGGDGGACGSKDVGQKVGLHGWDGKEAAAPGKPKVFATLVLAHTTQKCTGANTTHTHTHTHNQREKSDKLLVKIACRTPN